MDGSASDSLVPPSLAAMTALLALALPLVFFREPLLQLINDYRVYRRRQQYPHILVCREKKGLSTGAGFASADGSRTGRDLLLAAALALGRVLVWCFALLWSALSLALGCVLARVLPSEGASAAACDQAEAEDQPKHNANFPGSAKASATFGGTAPSDPALSLSFSTREGREETRETSEPVSTSTSTPMPMPVLHDVGARRNLFLEETESAQPQEQWQQTSNPSATAKQYYYQVDPGESERIQASSSSLTILPLPPSKEVQPSPMTQLGDRRVPSHGARNVGTRSIAVRGEHAMVRRKPAKRRLPSPMAAALAQQPVQDIDIDRSSLSEKMRKRRLNGEATKVTTGLPLQQQGGDTSRKRRKLNGGRAPLQRYVARRPAVGAWKTAKLLDKREREEREERLLRGMNRKRSKPAVPKSTEGTTAAIPSGSAPTATSTTLTTTTATATTTPATTATATPPTTTTTTASAPAFSFGQAPVGTAAAKSTPSEAPAAPALPSTPAPSFQFGATKPAPADPAKAEGGANTNGSGTSTAPAKPAPGSTAPPAFSFGAAAPTPAPSGGAPAFGGAPAPAPSAPTFGASAPAPAPSAPAFGTTAPAPAPSAPTFGASAPAPAFGASAPAPSAQAPSFGATPAPAFGAAAPASSAPAPSFGGAPVPAFGAAAPAPSFGAAPAPSFGAPAPQQANPMSFGSQPSNPTNSQFSFGNTKENQAPAPSNGFMKSQPSNMGNPPPLGMKGGFSMGAGGAPGFGGSNAGGFSAGSAPVVASGTASARRMARKSRTRRR
ncbi:unnamed protein product [Pseudo-nitzschia multistriata]|uniref:Uncharacterized protein n=1 Tax=Pseudo-nitzschia multistriata TaxID=183589 RepID=A0A448YVW7_9STRA|nr:unnamed protein product [Pseudo-nitzschia multistriata]